SHAGTRPLCRRDSRDGGRSAPDGTHGPPDYLLHRRARRCATATPPACRGECTTRALRSPARRVVCVDWSWHQAFWELGVGLLGVDRFHRRTEVIMRAAMTAKPAIRTLAFLVAVVLAPHICRAAAQQFSATLRGTVQDPTHAVVANAEITVVNTGTN